MFSPFWYPPKEVSPHLNATTDNISKFDAANMKSEPQELEERMRKYRNRTLTLKDYIELYGPEQGYEAYLNSEVVGPAQGAEVEREKTYLEDFVSNIARNQQLRSSLTGKRTKGWLKEPKKIEVRPRRPGEPPPPIFPIVEPEAQRVRNRMPLPINAGQQAIMPVLQPQPVGPMPTIFNPLPAIPLQQRPIVVSGLPQNMLNMINAPFLERGTSIFGVNNSVFSRPGSVFSRNAAIQDAPASVSGRSGISRSRYGEKENKKAEEEKKDDGLEGIRQYLNQRNLGEIREYLEQATNKADNEIRQAGAMIEEVKQEIPTRHPAVEAINQSLQHMRVAQVELVKAEDQINTNKPNIEKVAYTFQKFNNNITKAVDKIEEVKEKVPLQLNEPIRQAEHNIQIAKNEVLIAEKKIFTKIQYPEVAPRLLYEPRVLDWSVWSKLTERERKDIKNNIEDYEQWEVRRRKWYERLAENEEPPEYSRPEVVKKYNKNLNTVNLWDSNAKFFMTDMPLNPDEESERSGSVGRHREPPPPPPPPPPNIFQIPENPPVRGRFQGNLFAPAPVTAVRGGHHVNVGTLRNPNAGYAGYNMPPSPRSSTPDRLKKMTEIFKKN